MIAEVIVDVLNSNVDRVFDYQVPEGLAVGIGQRVLVTFANRKVEGFVTGIKEVSDYAGKLKEVVSVLDDVSALTNETLALARFMAKECHIMLAESLRLFIPSEMRGGRVSEKTESIAALGTVLSLDEMKASVRKSAKKQLEILDYLHENGEQKLTKLHEDYSYSAVKALLEKGFLTVREQSINRMPYQNLEDRGKTVTLNYEQQMVFRELNKHSGETFLLHGVTGSGKTEVYIEYIKKTIAEGKTAIMLVPEIGLTPQVMRRFRAEFGGRVALLHSGLSSGERYDEWWRLRRGEAVVAVGARSAVFAPLENLGVLIIDEEHEQSYLSENAPRYSTITAAKFRSQYNKATLILGSATPLIESYYLAKTEKYRLLELNERANNAKMPELSIIDMRQEILRGNNSPFSEELLYRMDETLKSGRQAMLFINRRGFSPVVVCSECGYVAKCRDCDVTLNYHREEEILKCHYCGARYKMLTECPECKSKYIRQSGLGTQKVAFELKQLYPEAKILRMDNDTTQNKESHMKITEEFAAGKADILVGTQMIAKGHDFANVTLVGILDADLSLYFSDYRASERTFSLITQVAGRAGRAEKKGTVVLQTHTPHNYILRLAKTYDYKAFYEREIALREAARFPPFASILRIMVSSESEEESLKCLKTVFSEIERLKERYKESFIFLNKMKSPVKKIKKKYRYQVLMRIYGEKTKEIIENVYGIIDGNFGKNTAVYLEINPSNLF